MKNNLFISIVAILIGGFSVSSVAADTLVKFKGGIGVIAVRSLTQLNVVRGVNPAGQPWVIRNLEASVKTRRSSSVVRRSSHQLAWRLSLMETSRSRIYSTLRRYRVSVETQCFSSGASTIPAFLGTGSPPVFLTRISQDRR